jgi:hypothetical protein
MGSIHNTSEPHIESSRIVTLTCCCCGDRCRGRQWWNRDTGYGFCVRCSRRFAGETQVGRENLSYGVRGYHYDISNDDDPHQVDSDCTVDPDTDMCLTCGVLHGSPCPDCGGRGYHYAGCESSDLTISQQAKTIIAETNDVLSAEVNLVALTQLAAEQLLNGFDYANQAWVRNGRYVRCGHPASMNCVCYGRLHQGELVAPGTEVQ